MENRSKLVTSILMLAVSLVALIMLSTAKLPDTDYIKTPVIFASVFLGIAVVINLIKVVLIVLSDKLINTVIISYFTLANAILITFTLLYVTGYYYVNWHAAKSAMDTASYSLLILGLLAIIAVIIIGIAAPYGLNEYVLPVVIAGALILVLCGQSLASLGGTLTAELNTPALILVLAAIVDSVNNLETQD